MVRATFPLSRRLIRSDEFRRVFKKSVRSGDNFFTVLRCPNDMNHARLGLAISRKAVGKAVQRNRVKRLVRESFRDAQHRLGAEDFVVMARPAAASAGNETLRESLARHFAETRGGTR